VKIEITADSVNDLRADLREAPAEAHRNIVKATKFSAFGIRGTAREFASGIAHAPAYPHAITFDVDDRGVGSGVTAEIGPDKDRRQGALGNLLEYGSENNAPVAHLGPALDRWSPDWENGLGIAIADALEGRT
jgi:hypothetical protein